MLTLLMWLGLIFMCPGYIALIGGLELNGRGPLFVALFIVGFIIEIILTVLEDCDD